MVKRSGKTPSLTTSAGGDDAPQVRRRAGATATGFVGERATTPEAPTPPTSNVAESTQPLLSNVAGLVAPPHPVISLPYPIGWWRVFAYVLSFAQPPFGLVLALLYWAAPDHRSRRFSRWALALALAGAVVLWAGALVWAGLQSGESGVQPW